MEIKSIKTAAQIDKETRHARVISCFNEQTKNFGQYSATRRAMVVAKIESQYPDGIKTVVGVIDILKLYNLWFPRPKAKPQKNNIN